PFKRHDELSYIRIADADENLLRRGLMADVYRKGAPELIEDEQGNRGHDGCERDEGKPREPVPAPARRQASARHAQEARDQDDVGEKLQEDDVGRKPANASQLEKKN